MAAASTHSSSKLVVFGEFFIDLVFYDLPDVPRLGEEVKTRRFAEFPGGGLATTALVASALGTPTAAITRIGEDARLSPAWLKLASGGVSIEACEFSSRLPTARTVCAAYRSDRMMITHDAINQGLHKLLSHPAVRRQLRRSKHVHLACNLTPAATWLSLIRRIHDEGPTISADIGWSPRLFGSPDLYRVLGELDFTFPNKVEALAMTGEKTVEQAFMKIAIIGAAGVRTPLLIHGLAGASRELRIDELAFWDTDSERLSSMGRVSEAIAKRSGLSATLNVCSNPEQAVAEADYVITSI